MQFQIKNFTIEPLEKGKYLKPYLAHFTLNGMKKNWEIVYAKDSVAILIYHKSKDAFILVKQFRAPVYFNNNDNSGITIELCAGLIDKDLSKEKIAAQEIFEETGYLVDANNLEYITHFYTSVGFAGSKQYLYYIEVDESHKKSEGGGIEGEELIEVITLPRKRAKEFLFDENIAKTPGLMFAIYWHLMEKQ